MQVKFNATGTHIQKGYLKVRLDFYPDESDKCYPAFYVDQWVREPTDEEMADDAKLALIPTHKVLTPCLCHFVTVPENLVVADFTDYILSVLDKDTVASIDDFILRSDSAHLISALMRNRCSFSTMPVVTKDTDDLLASTNDKLKAIAIDFSGGGKVIEIEPQSIDVGSAATTRSDNLVKDYTWINLDNSANADGTIDTFQVYAYANLTGMKFGLHYLVSGTTYKCRSSASIGNVTGGSMQTFSGLTLSVVTGDFSSAYWNATGYVGIYVASYASPYLMQLSGDHVIVDDSASYSLNSNRGLMSLYGTGTEGGGTAKTASDSGTGADSRLSLLASLVRADTGGSIERVAGRGLVINDAGLGADAGMIPGLKSIFGGDGGIGGDALKALIETSGAGSDMKLPGRLGQVRIPSKGVSL